MTGKATVLLLTNGVALLTATGSALFWLSMVLRVVLRSARVGELVPQVFLLLLLLLILVSSVHLAVRLKLRILREVRDPDLPMVKAIYRGASRVNLGAYLVLYPLTLALLGNAAAAPEAPLALFIVVAAVTAIPLWVRIRQRTEEYEGVKDHFRLGRHPCPACGVSLALPRRTRRWTCYRCGRVYA